ncbi:MAG: DUF2723 domain-containing protein [Chloroflexi bacterium]|nr:DUF2723 domain-containing protein [Chloroflexota bacterium]
MQTTKSTTDVPTRDVPTGDVPTGDVPTERLYRDRARLDWIVGAALFVLTFIIYLKTLAPSVAYLFDDSLEFQLLASRMAIAHPTGYPLYSILIKLATFLPFGDVAYRVNLVSALSAAGAVAFLYLAARLVTNHFMRAENLIGAILERAPALLAALVFAFGETFWSQAVLAEVYTLQAFLTAVMLWLVLRWSAKIGKREAENASRLAPHVSRFTPHCFRGRQFHVSRFTPHVSLVLITFFAGLMLTHHRISILIFPALAIHVLSYDRSFLRQPRTLLKMALAFALPLLLYSYLPIRGTVTSSLDGAYQNTPEGFLNWILGTAYTVFVTQNPLSQERDASYYWMLFANTFTPFGLLAAFGGFVAIFLRAWREWLLLTLCLAANLVFVLTYRVADIDVFFIPTFLLGALFFAAGLAGLLWLAYYALSNRIATIAACVGALVMLLLPFALYQNNYARVDLSNKRDIYLYGADIVTDRNLPVSGSPALIGILGEMSLVRYFQDTLGWGAQLETIAADKEDARLAAVDRVLNEGRRAYLTRPLAGVETKYSLSAIGPLILVSPKPIKQEPIGFSHTPDANFDGATLVGYDLEPTGEDVQLTLVWRVDQKIRSDRLVSIKLLNAQGERAAQMDRKPVLDAYPTTAWRKGEYIFDTYRVPFLVGAKPGEYLLQVTMYDPGSGKVFGQRELGRVNVPASTQNVASELLGVSEIVLRELGGIQFAGYDLDTTEPYAPGTGIPVTLLWRMPQNGMARDIELTVTDQLGHVIASQIARVGGAGGGGQYVRQELGIPLPETLAAGKYAVQVNVRGGMTLPFTSKSMTLGRLEVAAQ